MPRPKNPRGKPPATIALAQKADHLYALYLMMGPTRTLEDLRPLAARYGIKISLTHLKHYSTRDKWQDRIAEANQVIRESVTEDQVRTVQEMNRQQAEAGRLGVELAMVGLQRMLAQLRLEKACETCGIAPMDLTVGEAAGAIANFSKVQRTALGQATERKDFGIVVYNAILPEIVNLFKALNANENPTIRAREFASGLDTIIGHHVSSLREG